MRTTGNLLNVAQAAKELNLSPRTVLHRINAQKIAAEKVGSGKTNAYVITRDELERVKTEVVKR